MIRKNHVKYHPKDTNSHLMFETKSGNIVHYRAKNKNFLLFPILGWLELEIFKRKYLRKGANYKVIFSKAK